MKRKVKVCKKHKKLKNSCILCGKPRDPDCATCDKVHADCDHRWRIS